MSLTKCRSVAKKMPQSMVDELLDRIDELVNGGMAPERAQFVAANDMLHNLQC